MEQTQERRVSGVRRVSLERVVDVCDKGQAKSAFQAQSIDVSGRGMHVRASFLPELDAPLVLRFHEPDREIVVEGEVAWRTETAEGGGEFGVRFTALDSQSVRWLKTVCAQADAGELEPRSVAKRLKNVFDVGDDVSESPAESSDADGDGDGDGGEHEVDLAPFEAPAERSEDPSEQTDNDLPPVVSSTVKLHLAGLATPMRAEVKEQGHRRLDVGSNLEFLRVGRALEVEEVGVGRRRQAEIEGVNVAIDPRSQIPQLILSLRYPEPAASEAPRASEAPPPVTYAKSLSKSSAFGGDEPESEEDEARELFGIKLPEPVGEALERAQGLARRATAQCARLGVGARRATRWLKARAQRPERAVRTTRRTAPVFRAPPVQLRPQRGVSGPVSTQRAPAPNTRRDVLAQRALRRYGLLALLFVTAIGLGAWWGTGKRSRATASDAPVKARAIPRPAVVEPATSDAPPASNQLVATDPAPSPARAEEAELPRFAAQQPERTLSPAERVLASPPPAAKTAPIVFENVPSPSAPKRRETRAAQAQVGSPEFSRGKLHLPVIHRLRLDGPASRVVGEPTSSGFNVVIPGRKVMESGATISKRDRRISRVATRNNDTGAKIAFDFKGTIPAYKVRLRQDFVEIFISSSK